MIDTSKYEGHSPAPWSYTLETEYRIWDEHGAVWDKDENCLALVDDGSEHFPDADLMLMADAPLLLAEVKRLREALITVQQSLFWDEEDRAMDGDPITLEALFAQVEQVRSDITEMIE